MQDSESSRSEVQTNRTSITGVLSLPKSKKGNYYTGRKSAKICWCKKKVEEGRAQVFSEM